MNHPSILLVVDMQHDFVYGSLALPRARFIIPTLNKVIRAYEEMGNPIIFTKDFHPPNHISFEDQGGDYPPHCVRGTPGAQFAEGLHVPKKADVIHKGTVASLEAFSGLQNTFLPEYLMELNPGTIYVAGVALDICVLETCKDLVRFKFPTLIVSDCVVSYGSDRDAWDKIEAVGVGNISSNQLL